MDFSLFDVRCKGCGKTMGHLQQNYENLLGNGYTIKEALDYLQVERECCRMNMENPSVFVSGMAVDYPSAIVHRSTDLVPTTMSESSKLVARLNHIIQVGNMASQRDQATLMQLNTIVTGLIGTITYNPSPILKQLMILKRQTTDVAMGQEIDKLLTEMMTVNAGHRVYRAI